MNPHDQPDLTAHILGELDTEHAEAMAQWIAQNPEARAEAEGTADFARHLRATAPVSTLRLHPHQRDAILSGPQLVRKMVANAAQQHKRKSAFIPALRAIGQMAAAAVLIIAGFAAGMHFNKSSKGAKTDLTSSPDTAKSDATVGTSEPAPVTMPFRATEITTAVAETTKVTEAVPTLAVATVPVVTPPPAETKLVASVAQPPAIVKARPKVRQPSTIWKSEALVATTKSATAQVVLRPEHTRPALANNGTLAAAPITSAAKAPSPIPAAKRPELFVHSWKSEVASCPWDDSHRLLRLSFQIPGEQPAAARGNSYPLQVSFDATLVKSYRQLCLREVPATAADSPAFHVAWFEFVPNGSLVDAAREGTAKAIASVTVPYVRFTTAAMGPFDSTRLQVVDHGTAWSDAGDDFLFESAVTGFNLLLKGGQQGAALNHSLVLDLAQRSLTNDRSGERARFVKVVQEAQSAAGM